MNKRGTVKDGQGIFYGWVILGVVFITLVLAYGVRNSFSVFYPTIVEEFGWGRGSTALMFSISIIVYGLAAPLAGSLVDRFKPRLILALGGCILGGGIALCSLANSQWQFYLLFGVISAIGLSLVGATPLNTIVSHWFVKRRGLAFGITSAGFGTSLLSASIAQLLISSFDWRKAYIIIGVFAVAIIAPLCGFLMHRSPQDKGLLPDGETKKSPPPQDPAKPQMGEGGWAATGWTLSRAVKTYQFWLLFLIAFCSFGLAEQIAIAHQVYFFRDVGYEPMVAANIYSLFGIAFIIGTLCQPFLRPLRAGKGLHTGLSLKRGVSISFIPDTGHLSPLDADTICRLFWSRAWSDWTAALRHRRRPVSGETLWLHPWHYNHRLLPRWCHRPLACRLSP